MLALFTLMAWAHRTSRRLPERALLQRILVFAALFRLAFLAVGLPSAAPTEGLRRDLEAQTTGYQTFLLWDNDVWRYTWDGHLTSSGLSPYDRTPNQIRDRVEESHDDVPPLEADLWWDVLDNVSFRDYISVYPPVAQALFWTAHQIAPGSIFVFKLLIALIDLVACIGLVALLRALGRPARDVIFYAWNPLVVKEFAGSGHVDALMVCFLIWATVALVRHRDRLGHFLLGAAIASKIGAVILLPLFWRRTRPAAWVWAPLGMLIVSIPFLGALPGLAGGLGVYAREWVFNSGPWLFLQRSFEALGSSSPELWAHLLTKVSVGGVIVWTLLPGALGNRRFTRSVFLTLAVLILTNPAVMPWYLPWALPFAIAAGNLWWLVFSGLGLLSYLFYVDLGDATWWLWLEYLALFGIAGWEFIYRRPSATLSG